MNNQFTKQDTLLRSLGDSVKTGTAVFGVLTVLDFASRAIEGVFHAMAVPVWDAWDKYVQKTPAPAGKDCDNDGYPSAEEMFASLSPADQLKFKLAIEAHRQKQELDRR